MRCGTYQDTFSVSLLRPLCEMSSHGVLRVWSEQSDIEIAFSKGNIIYSRSARTKTNSVLLGMVARDTGELLWDVGSRKVVQKKCDLKRGRLGNIPFGRYSEPAIAQRTEEILFDLLVSDAGKYEYSNEKPVGCDLDKVELQAVPLILEAARRVIEMEVLTDSKQLDEEIFRKKESFIGRNCRLSSAERRIFALVNGKRSVAGLVEESCMNRLAVYRCLYVIYSLKLIERYNQGKDMQGDPNHGYYFAVISCYLDILLFIYGLLKEKLGSRALLLFEECKFSLSHDQLKFLKWFDPHSNREENIKVISAGLGITAGRNRFRELLVKDFKDYCQAIFIRAVTVLNTEDAKYLLWKTENELKHYIDNVENIVEVKKIYESVKDTLTKVSVEVDFWNCKGNDNNEYFSIAVGG